MNGDPNRHPVEPDNPNPLDPAHDPLRPDYPLPDIPRPEPPKPDEEEIGLSRRPA